MTAETAHVNKTYSSKYRQATGHGDVKVARTQKLRWQEPTVELSRYATTSSRRPPACDRRVGQALGSRPEEAWHAEASYAAS